MSTKAVLVLSLLVLASVGSTNQAAFKDLGFRFKDGKCVNSSGEEGLNPSYPGQCADFRGVVASRLDFSETDFSGARFDNADLQSTVFSRSIFTGATFESTNLAGVDFIDAKLQKVSFRKANLLNIKLAGADVTGADFEEADLSKTDLSYAEFQNCNLRKVKLESAKLENADLTGSDLSGANLSKAALKNANLSGVRAEGASFEGAILQDAGLENLAGMGASFKRAVLKKTNLTSADLRDANFRFADLDGSKIDRAGFKGAKFNTKTILPFPSSRALELGMVYQKEVALFVWSHGNATDGHVANVMKNIKESLPDVTADTYDGNNAGTLKEKIGTATVVLVPYLESAQNEGLVKTLAPELQAFVRAGGIVITTADKSGFLQSTGLLSRSCTLATSQTMSVPLRNSHPVAKDLGKIDTADTTFSCPNSGTDGENIFANEISSHVVAKSMGKGHVIWIGYCYYYSNPGANKLLINAIQMGEM